MGMRTPISTGDTTVLIDVEDILTKDGIMSKEDIENLRQAIQDIDKRLSNLEGRFAIVALVLGGLGIFMLNHLNNILTAIQDLGKIGG
jgi:hypothetical protein